MPRYFGNTALVGRLKNLLKLDRFKAFTFSVDKADTKHLIIEMNTIDQLYKQGINSKGQSLKAIGGDYAYLTKDIKSHFNQPFDRITLKDTGEFYESFNVRVTSTDFTIEADTMKDEDLTIRWGEDIIGLTDENMQRLIDFCKIRYVEYVRQLLQ